jgi:lysophospholipase L1-like esterase
MDAAVVLMFFLSACPGWSTSVRFDARPEIISDAPGRFAFRGTYDISSFEGKSTANARIRFWHEIPGREFPSFRVFAVAEDGSERFVATAPNGQNGPITVIDITDEINERLAAGRLKPEFVIREMSGMNPVFSVNTNKPVILEIEREAGPRFDVDAALAPVWKGSRMVNESLLPVSAGGAPAEGRLLFAPSRDLVVRNSRLDTVYEQGRDYVVEGNVLRLPPGSSIPFMTQEQLYPAEAGPAGTTHPALNGGFVYAFDGGLRDFQLAISYTHDAPWDGPIPSSGEGRLPRTKAMLRQGAPLKVVLLGDSISRGAGASWSRPPFLRSWGSLLIQYLEKRFGVRITFLNHGLGGTRADWGALVAPYFAAPEKPDLCLIAFGMNDGNGTPTADYLKNIKKIIEEMQAGSPETEFILVAPMLKNANWRSLSPMNEYLAALRTLESETIAVADVWSVSEYILRSKKYSDVSSNHLNHPDDFMVRIYTQVIAALFSETSNISSEGEKKGAGGGDVRWYSGVQEDYYDHAVTILFEERAGGLCLLASLSARRAQASELKYDRIARNVYE